jgi:hypothetical protein
MRVPLRSTSTLGALERFLLGSGPAPEPEVVIRARLHGVAIAAPHAGAATKGPLRSAAMRTTVAHLAAKARLVPLLRAWQAAGIDALVFKGFALAEFVYATPSERPYGDVDVLVAADVAASAERIARDLGWTRLWSRSDSIYVHNHEEAVLELDGTTLELHRFLLDNNAPDTRVQERITRAVVARSRLVAWEGVGLRVLDALDAALVGLVLARAWSAGDDWHLKPTDFVDLRTLAEHGRFTRDDLRRRADELGTLRTLDAFLEHCDPWRGQLDLEPPSFWERQRLYLHVAAERGHLPLERLGGSIGRAPGTLLDVLRHLPRLLKWRLRLLRGGDPCVHHRAACLQEGAAAPNGREMERLVRGVKWGARLLTPLGDPCRLRSLALYEILAERGVPVTLHVGRAAHDHEDAAPHLWITVPTASLRDLDDTRRCSIVEEVVCYAAARSDADRRPRGRKLIT